MIFPDDFRLFEVIQNNRSDAKIYLYRKSNCIFKGEIEDISPDRFDRLKIFLEELIQINNSKSSLKFGITEVQDLIKEFK